MSNKKTGRKKKQPEGLPKRNTVLVQRLSSPADPKKNNNKLKYKNIKIYKYSNSNKNKDEYKIDIQGHTRKAKT